jgi:hypothetical protein
VLLVHGAVSYHPWPHRVQLTARDVFPPAQNASNGQGVQIRFVVAVHAWVSW